MQRHPTPAHALLSAHHGKRRPRTGQPDPRRRPDDFEARLPSTRTPSYWRTAKRPDGPASPSDRSRHRSAVRRFKAHAASRYNRPSRTLEADLLSLLGTSSIATAGRSDERVVVHQPVTRTGRLFMTSYTPGSGLPSAIPTLGSVPNDSTSSQVSRRSRALQGTEYSGYFVSGAHRNGAIGSTPMFFASSLTPCRIVTTGSRAGRSPPLPEPPHQVQHFVFSNLGARTAARRLQRPAARAPPSVRSLAQLHPGVGAGSFQPASGN